MTEDGSFAARWSRRKQAVKEEAEVELEVFVEEPVELPEKTEAEVLAEFNLKDPDDMVAGDDFSAFMQAAIPQRLRNRALRKLWVSNPVLANLDGLLDYDEDFKTGSEIVQHIPTAYKIGKGFVKELLIEDGDGPESTSVEANDAADIEAVEPEVSANTSNNNLRLPGEIRAKAPLPSEHVQSVAPEVSAKPAEIRRKRMNFEF